MILAGIALNGCGDDKVTAPTPDARSYHMGFSWFPPRPDLNLALQTINLWSSRADAALILVSPPWDSLLAGRAPDSLVRHNELGLADHYRARGLRVIVSVDPTNGLDRSAEAPALVAAGRSIKEFAIQVLYRDYVAALDTLIHPDYIGIASETNLVRALASPTVYQGVVEAAQLAAIQLAAVGSTSKIFTTVQVETAWGALGGGVYQGIDQDLDQFQPQALGLSSYPYLGGYSEPDSIPLNYYSRLQEGRPTQLPMLVIEGGWPSDTVGAVPSDPQKQQRYIVRHARIQDQAGTIAWFQITFTDLDEAAYGFPPGQLTPFSKLGLVDVNLAPKPALATWDGIFARPRH